MQPLSEMTDLRRVAVICVLLALVAAACDGVTNNTVPVESESVESTLPVATRPDPIQIEAVDDATRRRIVEELTMAAAAMRSMPVRIEVEMSEEGEPKTATVRVDRDRGLLEAAFSAPTRNDSVITTRHLIVDDRLYFKSTASAEAEEALAFSELPIDPIGTQLLEEVFTGYGRLTPSLDRILLLMSEVPFAARVSELDNGSEISIVMSPIAIYNYYGESGVEPVGGAVPEEQTQLAFRVEDGVLVALVAGGVHFHDGEALEVSASVVYTPIEEFALDAPAVED